jgi:hypothetical protein
MDRVAAWPGGLTVTSACVSSEAGAQRMTGNCEAYLSSSRRYGCLERPERPGLRDGLSPGLDLGFDGLDFSDLSPSVRHRARMRCWVKYLILTKACSWQARQITCSRSPTAVQ